MRVAADTPMPSSVSSSKLRECTRLVNLLAQLRESAVSIKDVFAMDIKPTRLTVF
jgi:hypothetical protein